MILSLVLCAMASFGSQDPAVATPSVDVLAGLRGEHPRLILTDERLDDLRRAASFDPHLARVVEDVLARADRLLKAKPLVHELRGPRLLHVSRACGDRVYSLGLAWRWTGDRKYLDGLTRNLLTVCDFPDWNPSHFLDTAEMSHAVGIGYDWCFDDLEEAARERIRGALVEKGLEPGVRAYAGERPAWWVSSAFNWNQVCNGGLTVGALAVAESEPETARKILTNAIRSLPRALETYEPDGAWGEGPGYWSYATRYTVYGLAAMRSALGHDFELSERRGLSRAGYFPITACGPTGLYVAYADIGERARRTGLPALFWLAARYEEPALAAAEHRWIEANAAEPHHLIWYQPRNAGESWVPPLDAHFRGEVELALLRSDSESEGALFVALKAGYNAVNHGHLDLGNFELDALGVRWARDLGKDDYNLPGYWDRKQGGRRWDYYRLASHSHNVLLFDGGHQAVAARSKVTEFVSSEDAAHAIVSISAAWSGLVRRYRRGVALVADRGLVVVQDEFELTRGAEVTWGMTTDARITLAAEQALLEQDGQRLRATILSPANARFSAASAEREAPEERNTGVRRLLVVLERPAGKGRITVVFEPIEGERLDDRTLPAVEPLSNW